MSEIRTLSGHPIRTYWYYTGDREVNIMPILKVPLSYDEKYVLDELAASDLRHPVQVLRWLLRSEGVRRGYLTGRSHCPKKGTNGLQLSMSAKCDAKN